MSLAYWDGNEYRNREGEILGRVYAAANGKTGSLVYARNEHDRQKRYHVPLPVGQWDSLEAAKNAVLGSIGVVNPNFGLTTARTKCRCQ